MPEIKYQGAFQCGSCPMSNDPEAERSCPAWWNWVEKRKDPGSNVEVFQPNAGCGLQVGAKWMTDVIANNEFAVANAIAVRETIVQQISLLMSISSSVGEKVKELKEVQHRLEEKCRDLDIINRAVLLHPEPEKPKLGIFQRLLGRAV